MTSGFETCLIGEATGAGVSPGEVPVKVYEVVNTCVLKAGKVPTSACDVDKECASLAVVDSTWCGHLSAVIIGMVVPSNGYGAFRDCTNKASEGCLYTADSTKNGEAAPTANMIEGRVVIVDLPLTWCEVS